ncbi:hypothetical protein ABT120_60585 [Nonomuraea angiospora]|uniref:hypothetical protein n=1 Tax=Nonomuraea angiospora TaxID=46172 RepID=UPI00331C668B
MFTRMRFPYARKAAPEVLATARSQRWDPAEVVRVLLAEEVVGRDNATRTSRRKSANLPNGKTFDSWQSELSSIPLMTLSENTQGRSLEVPTWLISTVRL